MQIDLVPTSAQIGDTDIVLSIQSEHARRIYDGDKQFELRKILPKRPPRRIFLYETNGTSAITGHIVVDGVLKGDPTLLWERTGEKGTTKARFFNYFEGAAQAYAYQIRTSVKYKNSIKLAKLQSLSPEFTTPQSFAYLDRYPALNEFLEECAIVESLGNAGEKLTVRQISEENRELFIENVDRHISGSYLQTGVEYGKTLLEVSDKGKDVEGIFTRRKLVLEILEKNTLLGFTVVTEKLGGSCKTGPTIVLQQHRHIGYGPRLRKALHNVLVNAGYRKVYCTAPVSKHDALAYLFASGYRVEAHLTQQYHSAHDELVFGYLLAPRHIERRMPHSLKQVDARKVRRVEVYSEAISNLLQTEFTKRYCFVSQEWARTQVRLAARSATSSEVSRKDRLMYVIDDENGHPHGVGLYVPKRGGAMKLVLFVTHCTDTAIREMLSKALGIASSWKGEPIRRLYAHIPLWDQDLLSFLTEAGYLAEGILQRPYNDHDDMLVVARGTDVIEARKP